MDLFSESIEVYLETMEDMTLSLNAVHDFSESLATMEGNVGNELSEGLTTLDAAYDLFESDPDITDYFYSIMS